jgi:hypothetical protein
VSFWKRWFGSSAPAQQAPGPTREIEYRGFTIRAEPFRADGGQFQTAGTISMEKNGTTREHRFVRADRLSSADDALDFSIAKGRQIVDEQGERLFD